MNDTKTFNHGKGGFKVICSYIATIAGVIVVLAGLMTPMVLWLIDRGAKQEVDRQHQEKMVELREDLDQFKNEIDCDIEKLKKWQRDWPNDGELKIDVKQNTRLDEHHRRIGVLEK